MDCYLGPYLWESDDGEEHYPMSIHEDGRLKQFNWQIFARYTMGWWPSKLVVLLNIIVLLGYALIDCVVAGQILSAVSPNGSMSVVVGTA